MNPTPDEDQDSLFGSPPPSPVRGRSPSQETSPAREEIGDAVPSTGVGEKNVGTIALPGSHMSCAELPANLPASSLSSPRPTSSFHSSSLSISGVPAHAPAVTSRLSTRSAPSRPSSTSGSLHSTSSTRRQKTRKTKSLTPAPPTPPIALPGPNEPAPPNFLRSQSALLGLAGLVGSVKSARLYAHDPPHSLQPQSVPSLPPCGATPAYPIVLDDEWEISHIGKRPDEQNQISQRLDQLDPESLRSDILNSLAKEKNIIPVLESLISLLGGSRPLPSANPPSQPFARPYGHGIFGTQTPTSQDSVTTTPPLKRRKLKHVPAGAVDWDVPFPFAAGEGPEAYRDTWARDRAKQLVTQLLELIYTATRRAAIKTARRGGKVAEGETRSRSCQASRSASVEGQNNLAQESFGDPTSKPAPTDNLGHYLGLLETLSAVDSSSSGDKDGKDASYSHGTPEATDLAVPFDNSAFEEWLAQLQQFVPVETNTSPPEPNWGDRPSGPLDPNPEDNTPAPMLFDTALTSHTARDEVIDPVLLALSQQATPVPQPHSSTSPTLNLTSCTMSHGADISSAPPTLVHSPRTSLSSFTEPLTPHSEVFSDAPTSILVHQDLGHDPTPCSVGKEPHLLPTGQILAQGPSLIDLPEAPCFTAAQKGKARANASAVSISKGTRDKQATMERAQERRKQLVRDIERTKMEIWGTSIENAVLVHLARNESS